MHLFNTLHLKTECLQVTSNTANTDESIPRQSAAGTTQTPEMFGIRWWMIGWYSTLVTVHFEKENTLFMLWARRR